MHAFNLWEMASMKRPGPLKFSLLLCALCALSACADELLPQEPDGAYLLWRQALISGDADGVYDLLDKDTKAIFDERVAVFDTMSDDIVRYLPQVDQKLARQQTGVVLQLDKEIQDGRALFKAIFDPGKLEVTPGLEVGTEISDLTINETGNEAAVVVYSGQQFVLRKEEDGIWRMASWRALSIERTQWILDNRDALEQTVQDLINEEKEETDAIIKFLLAEDKRRKESQDNK